AARDEGNCSLSELCRVAARLCRGGGKCFFSYRSERLRELLAEMNVCHLEPKILRFVHHSAERDASLVLVEGRKDSRPGIAVMPPLILFSEDGKETAEYKRIYHRM
ncbi:MAG: methyltransferase, partial [Lachnospiraceae bacterium]|nr:methyltransferase [Lachnospiraceae bacterium]